MMGEVIRVSGRAPDVGQFLREAMLSQRFADVALCCPGGQRFLAHRLVLSAASPYLQEVLVAHSKASTHCEPITVILAEVEAPELAAILGFVYTGTATVPRTRLNAFLRAADTLRIRLPPVPVAITARQEARCKQEDVKDVKISPKYLHCDQYPACDTWYERTDRVGYQQDDDPSTRTKKDSCPGSCDESSTLGPPRDPRLGSFVLDPASQPRPRYGPAWPVAPGILDRQDRGLRGLDQSTEKDSRIVDRMDARRYHPASIVGPAEINEKCPSVCDQSRQTATCQPDSFCPSSGLIEAQNRLDPGLEYRLRPDYRPYVEGRLQTEGCDVEGERPSGNEAIEGEGAAAAALRYRTRSYERADHGEDLSCGESCCRWRTPRRHVANRVTASPWRQIIRPHHLPKIQPMILQTHHTDDAERPVVEPVEAARLPEVPSRLGHRPDEPANNDLYGFQVPSSGPEFNENQEPRPDFYPPQVPPSYPRTSPGLATTVTRTETVFQSPPCLIPMPNEPLQTLPGKQTYLGTAQGQKPELSHPVSRLCDTVEPSERKENYPLLEAKREEEEEEDEVEEKVEQRRTKQEEAAIYTNSDSNNNNNDPILMASESQQRARTQEDHRCEQCGKTFVTRASLKVHARTHSGEKPFRCADCGKQFSQLRNYKYHRSVHEGTREFAATCPECGKYFNDRGYLSSHMKIHRNRKEYGCAECGKSFNQRVAYNMHVRIHTGVKPHQCDQCGKAFSRKMLLKQHLRTHSGERPYQCQVCQKAFADRSNMTLHTRLHSGLKPYQCTLCSKAFTKKHHLKTHLNYHTGTKPYSCPNCGLRFSQSSNMRTHFKKCTVNNPAGIKSQQPEPTKTVVQVVHPRTPTDALTPPNSDQESSIMTPISKTAAEPNVT